MRKMTFREERAIEGEVLPVRSRSSERVLPRQLRDGLAPIHQRLLKWRSRSIWVETRLVGKNPDEAEIRRDAENLLNEVRDGEEVLRALEAEIVGASGESRISDTKAALQGIETAMYRVLALTGRAK